jgi:hypothetical protein
VLIQQLAANHKVSSNFLLIIPNDIVKDVKILAAYYPGATSWIVGIIMA